MKKRGRKPLEGKTVHTTMRIDPVLYLKFKAMCLLKQTTCTAVMTEQMTAYIRKNKKIVEGF